MIPSFPVPPLETRGGASRSVQAMPKKKLPAVGVEDLSHLAPLDRAREDPVLVELFGGLDRSLIFRTIFSNPHTTFRLRQLSAITGADHGNTSKSVRRWAQAGLLEVVQIGERRGYRAATHRSFESLRKFFEERDAAVRLGPGGQDGASAQEATGERD